jgi:hypothetical protein
MENLCLIDPVLSIPSFISTQTSLKIVGKSGAMLGTKVPFVQICQAPEWMCLDTLADCAKWSKECGLLNWRQAADQ